MLTQSTEVDVSICVANYNGQDIIRHCLDSILSQQGEVTFEVIVHDDASTDNSHELVSREYPSIRLLRSEQNVGYCISNNRMAAVARGKYILLLNNDAALFPDALQTLYSHSELTKKYQILTLPQYEWSSNQLIDRGMFIDIFANPFPNKHADGREVAMVMGSCMWMSRELWIELGGFPEWFGSLAEDMYICLLARLRGASSSCLQESGYRHRVGYSLGGGKIDNNSLVTSYKRRRLSERNKTFVIFILYPTFFMYFVLASHILLLLVEGIALSALMLTPKPFLTIYMRAIGAFFMKLPTLIKVRRNIQKQRELRWSRFYSIMSAAPHKLELFLTHGLPTIKS
jgi:GT2 family glycosyltransferase